MKVKDTFRVIDNTEIVLTVLTSNHLTTSEDYHEFVGDVEDYLHYFGARILYARWVIRIYGRDTDFQEIVTVQYLSAESFLQALHQLVRKIQSALAEGGNLTEDIESGAGYIDAQSLLADEGTRYVVIKGLLQKY